MATAQRLFWLTYAGNFLCLVGLLISIYGYIVEISSHEDPNYTPACDVNAWISCTKAINSRFGHGLGLLGEVLGENHWANQPNVVYGIFTYSFLFLLSMSNVSAALALFQLIAMFLNLLTVYLAAVLIYLRTLCLVCLATYIVNFALLGVAIARRRSVKALTQKKRQ